MQNKLSYLGIDVGNYDTKSAHTTLPSGYKKSDIRPTLASDFIKYNGVYYSPNADARFDYIPDKTMNDHMFILTLLSIVKELYDREQRRDKKPDTNDKERLVPIVLGGGIPPAHHGKLATKYVEYYKDHFSKPVEVEYGGLTYVLTLEAVRMFAQDYSVISQFGSQSKIIQKGYRRYYGIDIGGKTVDFVIVTDLEPTEFKSFESGILSMYDEIESRITNDYGVKLDAIACEDILTNRPTLINAEVKKKVIGIAQEWTDSIISSLRSEGLDFEVNPTVFIGGGARILKPYISKNKLVNNYEFLGNANANAIAYEKMLKATM